MSAPTPAPGDDRPREGYYPDPSIPGYVRYWNGASWVPGTSRPAPKDGEPLAPPPGVRPAQPSVEETGPHFFDEDPVDAPAAPSQHGSRPEPASAWGADRSRQSGFADDRNHRVSWSAPQGTDPRVPHAPGAGTAGAPGRATDAGPAHAGGGAAHAGSGGEAADGGSAGAGSAAPGAEAGRPADAGGHSGGTWPEAAGSADAPPAGGRPDGSAEADSGGTFVFRRPTAPSRPAPAPDEGTMTFRAVSPRTAQPGKPASPAAGGPGFGAGKAAAARATAAQAGSGAQAAPPAAAAPVPPAASPAPATSPSAPASPSGPQQPQQQAPSGPTVPHQAAAPQPAASAPLTSGPGGGQSSWAQQVHRLAGAGGDEQPVAPWKPPVEDPFQAAARRQAAARPAGLGKRLAARLIDTVVLAAVTSVAAVPLGTKAIDHVNDKIDAAELSGETVTVWLLDGTTATCLGIVLAVLLLCGVAYEALPTAKWGRTLGKRLLGLEVRDIEAHEPPGFGAALRRWLVYSVPGLLVVGVVGVLWCLFDRPWRQCWHDKAARTFVAG
ncbi:RDD family protein [Streptomyces viridiviolaceus]